MYLLDTSPILIIAAVVPAIVLLVKIYKEDRLEKEPVSLILSLVFLGVISTVGAIIFEELGSYVIGRIFTVDSVAYNFFFYYFVVGLSEEGSKYVLLKLRTWHSREFNSRFDGIVYAVSVSLGFALWENIGYVGMYGLETALVRAVTAVPGHCCFGIFMGLWYGVAKYFDNIGKYDISGKFRRRSLLLPMFIHGTYDFLTTFDLLSFLFIPFVIVIFVIAYRTVKDTSATDAIISNDNVPYVQVRPTGPYNPYGGQNINNPYAAPGQQNPYNPYNPNNQYNQYNRQNQYNPDNRYNPYAGQNQYNQNGSYRINDPYNINNSNYPYNYGADMNNDQDEQYGPNDYNHRT